MPNDERMTNVEGITNRCIAAPAFVIRALSLFRHFLIHIAFVALVALEFFNVFVGLLNSFAALLLDDLA